MTTDDMKAAIEKVATMNGMQVLYGQLDGLETVLALAEVGAAMVDLHEKTILFDAGHTNGAGDVTSAEEHMTILLDAFLAKHGGEQ